MFRENQKLPPQKTAGLLVRAPEFPSGSIFVAFVVGILVGLVL